VPATSSIFSRILQVDRERRFTVASAVLFALAFLPMAFGTAGTAAYLIIAIISLAEIVRGRVPLRCPPPVRFALGACVLFFALDAASVVLYANPSGGWGPAIASLHFLFLPVIFAALAPAEFDPVRSFVRGARIGAIVGGVVALIQLSDGIDRAMGGMINPLPFGATAAWFAFISLIGAGDPGWRNRVPAGAAFTLGLVGAFLSGARGAWLMLPFLALVALFYFKARYGSRMAMAGAGALVAVGAVAVIIAAGPLRERIDHTIAMFRSFEFGEVNTPAASLEQRALMLAYGLEAVADRPAFGYGPQNAVAEVRTRAADDGHEIQPYGHLHNAFLTETVGNGLVGLVTMLLLLAAPIVAAYRSARDERYVDRMAFAGFISLGAALYSLTNIVFGHDISNTVYASALLAVCLSAAAAGKRLRAKKQAVRPSEPTATSPGGALRP